MAQHTLDYKTKPQYASYKKRAEEKFPGQAFLTKDEFHMLSNLECHYCGKEAPNGIDRIDNKIGYAFSNCVPACKHCNYVKGDLSQDDFTSRKHRFVKKQCPGCNEDDI